MNKTKVILSLLLAFLLGTTFAFADIAPEFKKDNDELQRSVYGFYDLQRNTVSNIEFAITNTGILFYDQAKSRGTGIWPRGSVNYYVFGGGIWVGAQKKKYLTDDNGNYIDSVYTDTIVSWDRTRPEIVNGDTIGYYTKTEYVQKTVRKHENQIIMEVTYNPNNAQTFMVPGRIEDGAGAQTTDVSKYRVFFSIDYNSGDGTPLVEESAPIWPIWDSSENDEDTLKYDRYFGWYIHDEAKRNVATYPKGPAFISGEDIFCTYKDTDLSRYTSFGGASTLKAKGYPLNIQYEQMVYSWGFGDYRDFIFIKYEQQNLSTDTLWNMWLAPVFDVDIAFANNPSAGAANDRCSFYGMEGKKLPELPDPEKAKKNFAYQWSDGDRGEQGRGFGYVGFVFLESPAVIQDSLDIDEYSGNVLRIKSDSTGFVRKDKRFYNTDEQLGLVTYRNWSISDDKKEDFEMYQYISGAETDGDTGPGDKRYMMATGPFNLRPGDTSRTVVGLVLAGTGKGGDADGTDEDLTELVRKVDFAQTVYDNNFRAPQPPWRANITEWVPLNNGMIIKWDDESERSDDKYESGLDFLGYRIYRARRSNLDTFDVNNIAPSTAYPSGKGPLGWKLVAEYNLPLPFYKTQSGYGKTSTTDTYYGIDSLMAIGPYWVNSDSLDINAIRVMRIPVGASIYSPSLLAQTIAEKNTSYFPKLAASGFYDDAEYGNRIVPVFNNIDTAAEAGYAYYRPWAPFYNKKAKQDGVDFSRNVLYYKGQHNYLLDSVTVGVIHLNQSLAKINPLFYVNKTINISSNKYLELAADTLNNGEVWVIEKREKDTTIDGKTQKIIVDQKIEIDTLYHLDSFKEASINGNLVYTINASILQKDANGKKDFSHMLKTWNHFTAVRDSIYSYISKGWVREITFPDFAGSDEVRNEVIKPYMAEITNNRTFVDIGDDDGDAYFTLNDDIGKTEKIFNNVEYYYKILSIDEGDYLQPTPSKINEGVSGLPNFAETYPAAERVGNELKFNVISYDTNKIGGLYDFNLFAIDEQRASQLFSGDTLELEFNVFPQKYNGRVSNNLTAAEIPMGIYMVRGQIRNISKNNKLIYDEIFSLEPRNCANSLYDYYTEYTASKVWADSVITDPVTGEQITYGLPENDSISTYTSHVTTGNFKNANYCLAYGWKDEAYGTLGLEFNTTLQQYGGVYRPLKAEKINTNASTFITPLPLTNIQDSVSNAQLLVTRTVGNRVILSGFNDGSVATSYTSPVLGRFNNGPGVYEVEFLEGGEEELKLVYNNGEATKTIRAKYLIPKITNTLTYKRPAPELDGVDSVEVKYDSNIEHIDLPVQPNLLPVEKNGFSYIRMPFPFPTNLPLEDRNADEMIGKFNLYAQCYINARNIKLASRGEKCFAEDQNLLARYGVESGVSFVGTPGRYYISMIDGSDTIDFVHTFNISGAQFVADYLGTGYRGNYDKSYSSYIPKQALPDITYGEDFKAGDKIRFTTAGGALGFPVNGAKVRFAVSNAKTKTYTDDMLDNIKVVPNPYVISHQGQKSPYDAKLYFTKLPEKCTISIYTAGGDLVKTIDYDEALDNSNGKYGVAVWDLLTKNGQRVQSQTLVALIETPDGATTMKSFSIVVGGFRIVD